MYDPHRSIDDQDGIWLWIPWLVIALTIIGGILVAVL